MFLVPSGKGQTLDADSALIPAQTETKDHHPKTYFPGRHAIAVLVAGVISYKAAPLREAEIAAA